MLKVCLNAHEVLLDASEILLHSIAEGQKLLPIFFPVLLQRLHIEFITPSNFIGYSHPLIILVIPIDGILPIPLEFRIKDGGEVIPLRHLIVEYSFIHIEDCTVISRLHRTLPPFRRHLLVTF